jgi:hypothetical protein
MVEIEIGVLRCQCLDRCIDNPQHLISEIAAWERQRNAYAPASSGHNRDSTRQMGRAYPKLSAKE